MFETSLEKTATFAVWLLVASMLGGVAYVYLPTLHAPLLFDDALISRDRFQTEYGGFSMRARWIAYASIVWLGDNIALQRTVNVAVHLANSVLIALLALRLAVVAGAIPSVEGAIGDQRSGMSAALAQPRTRLALLLAVAWFALAPMAVYATAYLIQRSILLATFFVILMLHVSISIALRGGARNWGVLLALYAAAMLSKEYAVAAALPCFLIIAMLRRPPAAVLLRFGVVFGIVGVVASLWLYGRYGNLIGKPFDEQSQLLLRQLATAYPDVEKQAWPLSILNQTHLFLQYGARWFWPQHPGLSIDMRPAFPTSLSPSHYWISAASYLLLLLGSLVIALRSTGVRSLLAFSLFIPASLFVTEFAVVWIQDPFVLYRSYLWAISVPILVFLVAIRFDWRATFVAAIAATFVSTWVARDRTETFSSTFSAWDDAARKLPPHLTPGQSRIYLNRGQAQLERGELRAALRDFRRSTILGDSGEGLMNTGLVLKSQGDPVRAADAFAGARQRGMRGPILDTNQAVVLLMMGKAAEAIELLDRAESAKPDRDLMQEIWVNRSLAQAEMRNATAALSDANRALEIAPLIAETHSALGFAQLAAGDGSSATAAFDRSIELRPTAFAHIGRARAHQLLGARDAAIADVDSAIRLDPSNSSFAKFRETIVASGTRRSSNR